ncbi:hypothetical protein EHS14_01995 [Schaalia georgiae]|nr:hypothetical protein EHS14_01995 [Schaalia georgiae]
MRAGRVARDAGRGAGCRRRSPDPRRGRRRPRRCGAGRGRAGRGGAGRSWCPLVAGRQCAKPSM